MNKPTTFCIDPHVKHKLILDPINYCRYVKMNVQVIIILNSISHIIRFIALALLA